MSKDLDQFFDELDPTYKEAAEKYNKIKPILGTVNVMTGLMVAAFIAGDLIGEAPEEVKEDVRSMYNVLLDAAVETVEEANAATVQ